MPSRRFAIHWETQGVREIASAIEIATRMAERELGKDGPRISQSFIPREALADATVAAVADGGAQSDILPAYSQAELEDQAQAIHGS